MGSPVDAVLLTHAYRDELPVPCGWRVGRILLTQVGKTASPHARLVREVEEICPRAAPAYEGLSLTL
jgi:hypothetical protein